MEQDPTQRERAAPVAGDNVIEWQPVDGSSRTLARAAKSGPYRLDRVGVVEQKRLVRSCFDSEYCPRLTAEQVWFG